MEVGVAAGVLDQVVAPHESFLAQRARELLLPGVGACVSGELVRTGKLLGTGRPGARERSLS